jgi:hypothetical protein
MVGARPAAHKSTTVSAVEHHRSAGAELFLASEILDESIDRRPEPLLIAAAQREPRCRALRRFR